MSDPWEHRAAGMRCATCMWYAEKRAPLGRCRRHAPSMNGYPAVFEKDWCGDHKLSETAIPKHANMTSEAVAAAIKGG